MEKLKALTRRLAHRGSRSSLIKDVSTWSIFIQLMGYPAMTWTLIA
jgi:hypothetical protein